MSLTHRCRASGSWAGSIQIRTPDGAEEPWTGSIDPTWITEDAFPGRWSPMRALPGELDPMPLVVGTALMRGGVWHPGSGASCEGGLVVGTDSAFLGPSARFAHRIERGYSSSLSPNDFVFALPSTAASLLSKLYGLSEYQTAVVHGPFSGVMALGHALELMAVGRISRVVVAALSVGEESVRGSETPAEARLAAALYLEPETSTKGVPLEIAVQRSTSSGAEPSNTGEDGPGPGLELERFRKLGALAALPVAELADRLPPRSARNGEEDGFESGMSGDDDSRLVLRARWV